MSCIAYIYANISPTKMMFIIVFSFYNNFLKQENYHEIDKIKNIHIFTKKLKFNKK